MLETELGKITQREKESLIIVKTDRSFTNNDVIFWSQHFQSFLKDQQVRMAYLH